MKKPFLYYILLIFFIFLSNITTFLLGKLFKFEGIIIELFSKVVLLGFLTIQYFIYLKYHKKEDDFFEVKFETEKYSYLEKKNFHFSDFYQGKRAIQFKFSIFFLSILFFYITSGIGTNLQVFIFPLIKKFSFFKDSSTFYLDALVKLINSNLYLSFFLIVIIGPIFEEITFRGFSLSIKFEKTKKIIITLFMSFLFAILHFDFSRFFSIFTMGLALGIIYNLTESLIYPIIIHLINNGIAFIFIFSIIKTKNIEKLYQMLNYNISKLEERYNSIGTVIFITILLIAFARFVYRIINDLIEKDIT